MDLKLSTNILWSKIHKFDYKIFDDNIEARSVIRGSKVKIYT